MGVSSSKWKDGASGVDARVEVLTSDEEILEAAKVVASAFCGSTSTRPEGTLDWAAGPDMRTGEDLFTPLQSDPMEKRKKLFNWLAIYTAYFCSKTGYVLAVKINGKIAGAACIRKPTSLPPSLFTLFNMGAFLKGLFKNESFMPPWIGKEGKKNEMPAYVEIKLEYIETLFKQTRKENLNGPYYYLWMIGVDPSFQGQGVAGALLSTLNALSNRDKVPVYLETSGERNAAFYRKYGFRSLVQMDTFHIPEHPELLQYKPDGGEHFMLRDPMPTSEEDHQQVEQS